MTDRHQKLRALKARITTWLDSNDDLCPSIFIVSVEEELDALLASEGPTLRSAAEAVWQAVQATHDHEHWLEPLAKLGALLASEETPLTAEEEAEDRREAAELQRAYASGELEAEMIPQKPAEETPAEPIVLQVRSALAQRAAFIAQIRREVAGLRRNGNKFGTINALLDAVLCLPSLAEMPPASEPSADPILAAYRRAHEDAEGILRAQVRKEIEALPVTWAVPVEHPGGQSRKCLYRDAVLALPSLADLDAAGER